MNQPTRSDNRWWTGRMRRSVSVALTLALAWPLPAPVWASDGTIALPSLLEEARSANPDLLAARKRWEAAQLKVPQATGLPAPRIGIEFEEIPRGSIKVDQASLMFSLLQAFPFPGKLSARHQVAVKDAQVAAMAFKQTEWDIMTRLKAVYYDLYLLDREVDRYAERRLWFGQAAASAQAKYPAGMAGQAELLMAQAAELEAVNQIVVQSHRREAMAAHLNHLLSRQAGAPVGSPGPLALTPLPFSHYELMALAEEHQPELLAFRFMAERAEAAWKLSKRELLPDVETVFELRNPAMGPAGPWDLMVALVLPFWFWTKARYGVKVALADRESAEAASQAMRNEIARRVHEHWHEAFGAYETARLLRDGLLPLARQAVTSALAAYQGGRGSYTELAEAMAAYSEQQRRYDEALVRFEQHVVMLEQATGVLLRGLDAPAPGGEPSDTHGGHDP